MNIKLKKWGNTVVIRLSKEFLEFKGLSEGDWVDISRIEKSKGGQDERI